MTQTERGDNSDLTIVGNFHDVEITETFTNVGTLRFYGGKVVWGDRSAVDLKTATHFDTVETASASNDCNITINGGTYTLLLGGNRLFDKTAPIGTYSGNMTITVGGNATASNANYSGLIGMNYLTGTVNATINNWGDIPLRDNVSVDYTATNQYDTSANTGKLTVNVAEGVTAERCVTGDFSGDGALSVADVISALHCMLNGKTGNAATHFYGVTEVTLRHVLQLIRLCVQ